MVKQKRQQQILLGSVVAILVLGSILSESLAQTPLKLNFPLGLNADSAYIPEDNPLTAEKVALGKQLYFDKRLSADNTVACATCHNPRFGFTDGHPSQAG